MTGGRRSHQDDEDLVVLARRQPLTDAERAELAALLDADPTLRIAHDTGRAFDDVAFVRPGDDALIARVVDRTAAIQRQGTAKARWRVRVAAAAALVLVAGAAAAYWAGVLRGGRRTLAPTGHNQHNHIDSAGPARRVMPAEIPAGAPAAPARAMVDEPASPMPGRVSISRPGQVAPPAGANSGPERLSRGDAEASTHPARVTQHPRGLPPSAPFQRSQRSTATPLSARKPGPDAQPPTPTTPAPPAGPARDSVTAAELFRRASTARRNDALAEARALYHELQARFPATEEARLSHVSLAKLLLVMGQPAEAEHQFGLYLAGGAGMLGAEAAFGRAQSFERMGRPREERAAWIDLLRDFGGSIYTGTARRRIAALDASGLGSPNDPGAAPASAPVSPR